MSAGKAVIGQSGGPTAVINRSLVGFIKEAVNHDFDEISRSRGRIDDHMRAGFKNLLQTGKAFFAKLGKFWATMIDGGKIHRP